MALENQRYGRNKDTSVNKTYIESGEYRRKFDNVTDNPAVNKSFKSEQALLCLQGAELATDCNVRRRSVSSSEFQWGL